jgi:hypothetical protein
VAAAAARSSERVQAAPRERSLSRDDRGRITPARVAAAPPHVSLAPGNRGRKDERVRDSSPAEVHIHIGRIELTAVAPPAPPRRQSTPGKPAMSLDEYLQRRERRAR